MRRNRKSLRTVIIICIIAFLAIYVKFFNGSIVYISTGFSSDELFKTGSKKGYTWEADILLSDIRKEYENIFGGNIWNQSIDGIGINDYAKNQIKTELVRVKMMDIMAEKRGVVLSRSQKEQISVAATQFYNSIGDENIKKLGITKENIEQMLTDYSIAGILYDDMTSQIGNEVSSDDARVITVQYICCDNEDDINNVKKRLDSGEAFYTVAKDYGGEKETDSEIKRGEMDKNFEEAAYNLKTGDTSGIVESLEKYYIIKCTSDNVKYKTEANKKSIVAKMKLDYFNEQFADFEASQYVYFNKRKWKKKFLSDINELPESFKSYLNGKIEF